ncbi:MAG TPA: hypothetical protein VFV20_05910 [Candidatus Limnocylindria bacterium]|jgi:hypothetical protein|nr:hypothetical protein [Candidatus Limnocylindria bacterium]
MYSSLISKIEKAKRYAEEPERITFETFDVRFRGDNGSHRVSLRGDDWTCECDHFHTTGLCAHVMTMQRVFASHLSEAARYTTEHVVPA